MGSILEIREVAASRPGIATRKDDARMAPDLALRDPAFASTLLALAAEYRVLAGVTVTWIRAWSLLDPSSSGKVTSLMNPSVHVVRENSFPEESRAAK